MNTTRQDVKQDGVAVFTLRVERPKLERLRDIAAGEHRSLVQQLRSMIDREIERAAESERSAA